MEYEHNDPQLFYIWLIIASKSVIAKVEGVFFENNG